MLEITREVTKCRYILHPTYAILELDEKEARHWVREWNKREAIDIH
jgi:hydrogenase maturation factor